MTHKTVDQYTAELAKELRKKEVAGEVIGDAVAQVESHVAEDGDDPTVVFGTPREFAKQLARGRKKPIGWPLYVASVVLTFGGGVLLLKGAFGVIQNQQLFWGMSPIAGIIVGSLAIVAWVILLVAAADPIRDPRRRT
jgi:hypothetical protein